MRLAIRVLALSAIGAAAFAPAAHAQDMSTYSFGGTTLYIGGGFQYLTLPDIKFTGQGTVNSTGTDISDFHHQKNSDFSEYGGGAGGGIETALGFWGSSRVTGGIKGFWTNVDNTDRQTCRRADCIIVDPTGAQFGFGPPDLVNRTNRDVDYWGASAELKFGGAEPVSTKPNFYRNDYFIVGADIRGLDQNNKIHGKFEGDPIFTYRESLDTTYYGGYIGIGGEYSFGFLGVGGLTDRLGLRTFINLKGGLYSAETDYDGRFAFQFVDFGSRISKSNDDLAFIGTVSLETRKQIGTRTSLSLWTDYEYISSVPDLQYARYGGTTRISDDDSFATRTMLRLNIGLGSEQLYQAPLK
jgi:hypothetical protein